MIEFEHIADHINHSGCKSCIADLPELQRALTAGSAPSSDAVPNGWEREVILLRRLATHDVAKRAGHTMADSQMLHHLADILESRSLPSTAGSAAAPTGELEPYIRHDPFCPKGLHGEGGGCECGLDNVLAMRRLASSRVPASETTLDARRFDDAVTSLVRAARDGKGLAAASHRLNTIVADALTSRVPAAPPDATLFEKGVIAGYAARLLANWKEQYPVPTVSRELNEANAIAVATEYRRKGLVIIPDAAMFAGAAQSGTAPEAT